LYVTQTTPQDLLEDTLSIPALAQASSELAEIGISWTIGRRSIQLATRSLMIHTTVPASWTDTNTVQMGAHHGSGQRFGTWRTRKRREVFGWAMKLKGTFKSRLLGLVMIGHLVERGEVHSNR
jgi:hypothetical protein